METHMCGRTHTRAIETIRAAIAAVIGLSAAIDAHAGAPYADAPPWSRWS